ncbi:MAG: hypothetical protein WCD00_13040 [Desulfuromonadaceae bacterium]
MYPWFRKRFFGCERPPVFSEMMSGECGALSSQEFLVAVIVEKSILKSGSSTKTKYLI